MAKKSKEVEEKDDDVVEDDEPELTVVVAGKDDLETPPTRELAETEDDDEDGDTFDKLKAAAGKDVKGSDKKKKKDEENDEDEDEEETAEDKRLGASEESEEDDEKKRATHKSRRQRRREAENRLRNENRFYELRNERLEKQVQELIARQDQSEAAQLEGAIASRRALITKAEKVEADATTAGKGDEAVEAKKIREQAQKELDSLEVRKEGIERDASREQAAPDPVIQRRATKWIKDNDWFDPQLGDIKSKLARTVDLELTAEGFDPKSADYWTEFDSRLQEHGIAPKKKKGKKDADEDLDDDADEDEDEPTPRKKKSKANGKKAADADDDAGDSREAPRFRSGGPGRDLKNNEVFLSRDRIAAMKEAGTWDDPVARKRQLKKYQEWDKKNEHLYREKP